MDFQLNLPETSSWNVEESSRPPQEGLSKKERNKKSATKYRAKRKVESQEMKRQFNILNKIVLLQKKRLTELDGENKALKKRFKLIMELSSDPVPRTTSPPLQPQKFVHAHPQPQQQQQLGMSNISVSCAVPLAQNFSQRPVTPPNVSTNNVGLDLKLPPMATPFESAFPPPLYSEMGSSPNTSEDSSEDFSQFLNDERLPFLVDPEALALSVSC